MFHFYDPDNVESIILFANMSSCSNSVLQTVERSGNYYITVFPVRGESGIADSQVSHAEELIVGNSESPVSTSSSGIYATFPRGKIINAQAKCQT
jgi:hypothetical protein